MPVNCKMCGTSNSDDAQCCIACGTDMNKVLQDPSRIQTDAQKNRAKTMLFGKAPKIPAATRDAHAAQTASAAHQTVLGAPVVQMVNVKPSSGQSAPIAKPVSAAKPVATTNPSPSEAAAPVTPAPMIKMASPKAAQPGPAQVTTANKAKTMVGLPTASAEEVNAAVAAAQAANKTAKKKNAAATGNRPTKTAETEKRAPAQSASTVQELSPANTSPEMPAAKGASAPILQQPPAPQEADSENRDSEVDEWPDEPLAATNKSNMGIIIAVAAAAAVILALVAFILFKFVLFQHNSVQPQIVASQDGKNLTVMLNLPDAAPGATVQLQNQTIPVTDGKVQFLLPKKQMVLGTNIVKLQLMEPNNDPEEIRFPITLRHVATNDFSGLASNDPSIVVRFQIADGFNIMVNGAACPLKNNTCTYTLNIGKNVTGPKGQEVKKLQYTIPFELSDAAGNSDAGQHIISIPFTELQLDRPAEGAVVDTNEISVQGSSVPGAAIEINGQKLTASETGFSATIPLMVEGPNKIIIKAMAAGAAPITREVTVTKVNDLTPYIESWSQQLEEDFDFAKLSRNTDAHAGKKIRLTGRIVNINTAKGVTAFLMYVDNGCPQGGQCGIYVAFRGETEAGLQSMVNVYGTVRGIQNVDFAGGSQKALPAIDATYVTIAETKSKKRK